MLFSHEHTRDRSMRVAPSIYLPAPCRGAGRVAFVVADFPQAVPADLTGPARAAVLSALLQVRV